MRRLRKMLLAVGLAGGLVVGIPAVSAADDPSYTVVLPGGLTSRPEGVAVGGGHVYASSVADGTIFRADLGDREASVFLPPADGRTASTGIKVAGGRLFISGAGTGKVFVYDIATKALLHTASVGGTGPTFVNDVAVAPDGTAYFTDSQRPVLYSLAEVGGVWTFSTFVSYAGTPFVYQSGFNANGIAIDAAGRYALVVQSNTGKLFRIDLHDRSIIQVDLGGAALSGGDGLVLRGQTLYVVASATGVTKVRLRDRFTSGRVIETMTDPTFAGTTTGALSGNRLYLANAQFAQGANAALPFTLANVKAP